MRFKLSRYTLLWVLIFVVPLVVATACQPTAAPSPTAAPRPTTAPPKPTQAAAPAAATPATKPAGTPASQAPTGGNVSAKTYSAPPAMALDLNKKYSATIDTNKGTIKMDLLAKEAPQTVNNFVFLARDNYFDGIVFHRYEPNFVIQGGDPQGKGTGGPGYRFNDEPVTLDYKAGTVAMANAGPNTNGSQFFICLNDLPSLPKKYTIFGQVTSGMDTVLAIRAGDKMNKVTIEEK